MKNKTISAISTPLGSGGIGIIRISGPRALAILKRLFIPKQCAEKTKPTNIEDTISSHRVYYGHISEANNGEIIDEVLAIYMQRPKSYTREDVVEIHAHSGYVVLDRILSAVVDAGAELAAPGEFTQRAFLNGRIDLSQAEAVIDLINAPCETAARMASRQVTGAIKDAIGNLNDALTAIHAKCETMIEFGETDDLMPNNGMIEIRHALKHAILPEIESLIQRQKDTAIFRDGVLLAIGGAPNVGKSSLLNQLIEKETAIVSEVPGTTRDVVREYLSIKGVPVIICDTAGIHDTVDPVECLGIERARDHIDRADIVLLVLEANRRPNSFEENLIGDNKEKHTIIVINKNDIGDSEVMTELETKLADMRYVSVSAKTGNGIEELKELIFKGMVIDPKRVDSQRVTPNLRHRKILEKVITVIQESGLVSAEEPSPELVADSLRYARRLLEGISGNRQGEDLYDHIFSQFCIGK